MRGCVLVVEEAPSQHLEVANLLVLRADAKEHGVLGDAAAHRDALVVFQHGRTGDNAGNLLDDGVQVLDGHLVGRGGVVRSTNAAADVLHLDHVGADGRDHVERILPAGEAEGGNQDDGGGADNHAEHGQEEAAFTGAKAVDRKTYRLAEGDRGASAGQRSIKGLNGGCQGTLLLSALLQYRSSVAPYAELYREGICLCIRRGFGGERFPNYRVVDSVSRCG